MLKGTIVGIAFVSLLLIGLPRTIFNIRPVEAIGTIYIRADGSIDPPDALISTLDNKTYTLIYNISSSIVIERGNIVLRGMGYTVQGDSSATGISLLGRRNVTITGMKMIGFFQAIYLENSSNNVIVMNSIVSNSYGIELGYSSDGNDLRSNNVTGSFSGIRLIDSSNNAIHQNLIYANQYGLDLDGSANNTITENTFTSNSMYALESSLSSDDKISYNNITNNNQGIILISNLEHEYVKWNETVSWNNILQCGVGIEVVGSSDNVIARNNIDACQKGIYFESGAAGNRIFHNVFTSAVQVYFDDGIGGNVWDDGYPSGGNYWGDYPGSDKSSGPYQNVTGSDGIGDTPYVMESSNQDHYPFMEPYIQIVGDVNQDGKVDIKDVYRVAQAYGSFPGQLKWDPACDIYKDGQVDVRDYYLVCKNYGKENL